jgi:hypothetical protein
VAMKPVRVEVNGKLAQGYYYLTFAGVWVFYPSTGKRAFMRVRGRPVARLAKSMLRHLALPVETSSGDA